jgi:hypothetical protein
VANAYTIGCAVLGASAGKRSRYVIGASGDKVYTDKATVKKVQRQLHALALATGNKDFDPYSDGYKDDGVLGTRTQLSVMAFNQAYGWPSDNQNITDGTLDALQRPDVVDPKGYAAKQAAFDAVAATTPQEVHAAAAKVAAVAPPAAKPQALAIQAAAAQATTQDQLDVAKQALLAFAGKVQPPDTGFEDKSGPPIEWAPILFGGAVILGLGAIGYELVMGKPRRRHG